MLFRRFELRAVLEERDNKLTGSVESVSASEILSRAPDHMAVELCDAFRVEPPVLRESDIQASQEEAQVDVSHDPQRFILDRSSPFYLSGTRVSFHVPFDGDPELFGAQPSSFTFSPPNADVRDGELVFTYERLDHDAQAAKAEFERELAEVRKCLSWIQNDVAPFNESLRAKAKQRIERRREKLLKDQGMVSQLGYPLRRREEAPRTYTVPAARRRSRVARPARGDKPFVPEPALELAEYNHIISIIDDMVKVMERSPAAFKGMKEEHMRTHFLVQLNAQYEGQATGETFNNSGKTDILIRADNKNIFVAETKFWSGPKGVVEALDQLLSYATWRDGKLCLIIFNRRKNLSAVVAQIPGVVRSHPRYRRDVSYEHDGTGWRFVVHHPDDADRELLLTVLVYDVPA